MTEPVFDPDYWRKRLEDAKYVHQSVYLTTLAYWQRIEDKHREILHSTIGTFLHGESVLDCGCGYGRIYGLLPKGHGSYLGIDLSPALVGLAREMHQDGSFIVGDLTKMPEFGRKFDWAVLCSMRRMVRANVGDDAWYKIETNVRKSAKKLLYLEYDEHDNGSIE